MKLNLLIGNQVSQSQEPQYKTYRPGKSLLLLQAKLELEPEFVASWIISCLPILFSSTLDEFIF